VHGGERLDVGHRARNPIDARRRARRSVGPQPVSAWAANHAASAWMP
jgi:hypothetical protein